MRLRIIPRVPAELREIPDREVPDEYRIRSYRMKWDELRFIVEARRKGRVLGDRPFGDYPTAREHAQMNAKWDGAYVTDHCESGGYAASKAPPDPKAVPPEISDTPVQITTPQNVCEKCGEPFEDHRNIITRSMARKRYCSERCRKSAEAARAYERRKEQGQ